MATGNNTDRLLCQFFVPLVIDLCLRLRIRLTKLSVWFATVVCLSTCWALVIYHSIDAVLSAISRKQKTRCSCSDSSDCSHALVAMSNDSAFVARQYSSAMLNVILYSTVIVSWYNRLRLTPCSRLLGSRNFRVCFSEFRVQKSAAPIRPEFELGIYEFA